MPWIVDTNRLSKRQKGAMPRNGLQENVFCLLRSRISDFLHSSSSSLFVAFFRDIRDAFGTIDHHQFMIREMVEEAGYPQEFIDDITSDIYHKKSTFQVKKSGGRLTRSIQRGKGIHYTRVALGAS